ncbi:hypothetical protein ACWEN6_13860 [Sphaerisporangium sp. NPDC004334]
MGVRVFETATDRLTATILPLTDPQMQDREHPSGATHVLLLVDGYNREEIAVFGTAAELDRWVRRVDRQAAGALHDARRPGPVYVLADELARAVDPALGGEDDRLALADRLLTALEMSGLAVVPRRREREEPRPRPVVPAHAPVDPLQIQPGFRVSRYTEPAPRGRALATQAPCCSRWVWIRPDVDSVTGDPQATNTRVLCSVCAVVYEVDLVPDSDGGFWAVFTVQHVAVAMTRRTAARRAR